MRSTAPAAVAETHSAVLFFVGDRAYKLKKPVDLGFLDFRSRETREAVCHHEVELNRRMAPEAYLGVADVMAPDGGVCDHLVVMRRMPSERRLSSLLSSEPAEGHLSGVARLLAALHARSPRSSSADEAAGVAATRARWERNTDALIDMAPEWLDDHVIALVHGLACRYLDGRGPLLEWRIERGKAVDGYGDLLADDIFCLDDGPRVLDCIEFDDTLRLGDGLADAAFLAMDLEHLGRPDLGAAFLAAYAEHSGDSWPSSLAHHHVAYRAQVRAKVMSIRAQQGDTTAADSAARLLDLSVAHLDAGRVRLILVGGLPGTGKSTLARRLASELGASVLRSDEIRKELAGIPTDQRAPAPHGAGIYSPASTEATYQEMLDRATAALGLGETVVLDASWSSASWRSRARSIAAAASADLVELRCDAPATVAAERLRRRHAAGDDASDATPEIAASMQAAAEPWREATTIDTAGDRSDSLAAGLQAVQRHAGTCRASAR